MEKWQKELFEIVENVTEEVDHFFSDITGVWDAMFELSEAIAQEVQQTIVTEIDQYLNDWAEPLFDLYGDDLLDDFEQTFPYQVTPTVERHSACIGCANYHGQVYSGNLLVCGMHPYGWDDEQCPDWEQEN